MFKLVSITTSLGETVSFENRKIMCRGFEQTVQNPEGLTNFEGDENAKKHHQDRVRSSLVKAILLEQVAGVSFNGSFDTCLQTAKELLQLQEDVNTIRKASFSELSNPGYVRKQMNIITNVFNEKWAELKMTINSLVYTDEEAAQFSFLKLGKIAAKKDAIEKYRVQTANSTGKPHALKIATNRIIKQAGHKLDRLTDKAITARCHKNGVADIDSPYVFAAIKTAKEELLKNRIEKQNIKKQVVKENREASTVSVETLRAGINAINRKKNTIEMELPDDDDDDLPIVKAIAKPLSIPENRDDFIKQLQAGNVSAQCLANIRAKVINTKDINLHIQTMIYLGNKGINKNEYVTLGLINVFPEWFDKCDVDALKYPLEDVQLTEDTFGKFFSLENIIGLPSVLNYCIEHFDHIDWLTSISKLHTINNTTVKLLANKYSIVSRVLAVVGK